MKLNQCDSEDFPNNSKIAAYSSHLRVWLVPYQSASKKAFQRVKFDLVNFSCSALDEGGDMLHCDTREVGESQAILKPARRGFLVADRSTFRRRTPACIGSVAQVDSFYTDLALAARLEVSCKVWGKAVCRAQSKQGGTGV